MKSEIAIARRSETGKGAARLIRKQDKVPGVFYGPKTDTVPVSLDPKELKRALKSPMGRNTILILKADDGSGLDGKMALLKDEQHDQITRAKVVERGESRFKAFGVESVMEPGKIDDFVACREEDIALIAPSRLRDPGTRIRQMRFDEVGGQP